MSNTQKRVNIQFSIDLADLPPEVSRLFKKASEHTAEASQTFGTFAHQEDPLTVASLNKIGDIRLALTKADLVLNDLENIVSGFLRMQATPPEEVESAEPPVNAPHYAAEMPMPPEQPAVMPPRNPFASTNDNFTGSGLSLEELQNQVQKAVQGIKNEKSPSGNSEEV